MSSLDTKYFGILKNFDTEKITITKLEELEKIGIFESFDCDKQESYFHDDDDFMGLCDFYVTGEKEYCLKKEVYKEMFDFRAQYLEQCWEIEPVYYEIDEAITKEFLIENKIIAINKMYDKYLKIIKELRFYNLYKNNSEINGYESWFEYFEENIGEYDKWESLEKYLKGNRKYLPKKFEETWNNCYSFLKISEYCETKKNEILNTKPPTMSEENKEKKRDLSFRLSLFELILSSYKFVDANPTQKGNLLTHLLGNYNTNIRDYYEEIPKKENGKFKKDGKWDRERTEAEEIIKKILG